MYADFTSLIRAGRVLKCMKAASNDDVATLGTPCSIFIVPLTIEVGDIVIVDTCTYPYTGVGESRHDCPVVAGDWSPVIFNSIGKFHDTAGNILAIGTDYYLFIAPIEINDR